MSLGYHYKTSAIKIASLYLEGIEKYDYFDMNRYKTIFYLRID